MKFREQTQNFISTVKTVKSLLGFIKIKKASYVTLKAVLALKNTSATLIYTILPGIIINELVADRRIPHLSVFVGLLTLTPLLSSLLDALINTALAKTRNAISLQLETDFYRHTNSMDYEHLENPEVQTVKQRASETVNSAVGVIDTLIDFGASLLSMISVFAIITNLNILIVLVVAVTIYVNSLITKWIQKKQYQSKIEVDKEERKLWGYGYIVDNFHFAKELRLFGLSEMIIGKISDTQKSVNSIGLVLLKEQNKANLTTIFIQCLEQVFLYIYLIYLFLIGTITVGGVTLYQSATSQFFSSLTTVVNVYLSLCAKSLSTEELIAFMDMPKRQLMTGNRHSVFDEASTIEFRDVSFRYPGSERYALRHLNLTIKGDSRLCIVGTNGSGKSTFIKLLTRLYFPTEGEILLNGTNINEYDYLEYQRLFAPVFQDFCMFYFSLKENIVLAGEYDVEKLDRVTVNSGLSSLIPKLGKGYDTQVDKWIDEEGFEPSGGEGQRIAIARAQYHGGDVFILDEPTAALDPSAEYEIYTQFNEMITDKCAVLITHRLSAVQLADNVAVFDEGRVAEYGTHQKLYAEGGLYTEMFDKQAQFYRDNAGLGIE